MAGFPRSVPPEHKRTRAARLTTTSDRSAGRSGRLAPLMLILAAAACNEVEPPSVSTAEQAIMSSSAPPHCPTCQEQDFECGIFHDPVCGDLSCGTCPTGQKCGSGNKCVCSAPNP